MEVITLFALLSLPGKMLAVLKSIKSKEYEIAASTAALWVLFIVVLALAGAADVTAEWVIVDPFPSLGELDFASQVILGLMYGSGTAQIYDFRNAIDNTSTAREPKLLGPRP